MIATVFWFGAGLVLLIGGAELMVRSVSKLALRFGISKLVIGLTVVAFGTSAPELAVSIQAGVEGNTDLMLGNIVGSNISNTLLILGISALVMPLKVRKTLIKADVPVMIAVTLLVFVLAQNGFIGFWECVLLTLILFGYLLYLARQKKGPGVPPARNTKTKDASPVMDGLWSITGLIALATGARWLIGSAIILAEIAGISELVIGLTVVAIGTSLPEIVVSLVAVLKGERDMAVGGVVGSNIMNFLAVLGVSGLFIPGPIPVQLSMLHFDFPVLIAASFFCIPVFYTGHKIVRWEGGLFLFFYFSYLFYLFLSTTDHDFTSVFIHIMTGFVLPVTVLAVLFIAVSEWKRRFRFRGFGKKTNGNGGNKNE